MGTLVFIALLELVPRSGLLPGNAFPPLSDSLGALAEQMSTLRGWSAFRATLSNASIALVIVLLTAVPAGLGIGLSELAYRSLRQVVELMRAVPGIVLLPIGLLIFGPTDRMAIIFSSFAGFWPLLYQAYSGVRNIEPTLLETTRVYRIQSLHRFVKVVLPGALPYLATGMRISATTVLLVTVAVELIGGVRGLGSAISAAAQGGNFALMYGNVMLVGVLGLVLNVVLRVVERKLLRWHPTYREEA